MSDENHEELIPTRATLIHRLKDWQDQASWQDFFDTYWKLIYSVAVKGGLSPAEAQDVVQETIISVSRHMPTFQYDPSIGTFKAWLLNMTRWRILDHIRKQKHAPSSPPQDGRQEDETQAVRHVADPAGNHLDALWEAEWENNLLAAAVAKIKRQTDPAHYQIFDCYVNRGWPPEKVAETFGVPVTQVYLIKHRITADLKDEVKRIECEMS
jgi:RNA polymerase sigma-70 factor (ECF subfamily)